MTFIEGIWKQARDNVKTIVLPEGYDERMLHAAPVIKKEGLANVILVGDKDEIQTKADSLGVDLTGIEIITPETYSGLDDFVATLVELRKHKGLTPDEARAKLLDESQLFFGAMLVRKGIADGMVAGASNSTGSVISSGLQVVGATPGIKTVSSLFAMVTKNPDFGVDGVLIFADCAINPNPNAQQLAEIAVTTAQNCRSFLKCEPKVAMLSFSSKGSASHPDVEKVSKALEIVKELDPKLCVDGELQLDAAIIPSVGQKKASGSVVAGHANVLIFPDLNSGNIGYKLVERIGEADAFGPIVQGLASPVNDLSRGCSIDDVINVSAITAVQAQS